MEKMKELVLPPDWCTFCRNRMSQGCIERCAVERDAYHFAPKRNMQITDFPQLDPTEALDMTSKELRVYLVTYIWVTTKWIQHFIETGETHVERKVLYRSPSRRNDMPLPFDGLQTGSQGRNPECESEPAEDNYSGNIADEIPGT